jgi:metallo-beta-lactamase class B
MPVEICIHPWKFRYVPFCIAGNLYYVGNQDVSSHLIDTGAGLILIDTTYPQTVYLLLDSIHRLGFNPDDIHTILHCHPHYDHCGGTRAMVDLTGARTALGREDCEILNERRDLSWATEYGMEFHESFQPDRLLDDGDIVHLGNTTIECLHTPGHTAGCMSYFFNVTVGTENLTAGIFGGPGLNTLSDNYLNFYKLPVSRRSDYLASVQRLKSRHVDIFIGAHPEHNDTPGRQSRLGQGNNPFMDPQGWQAFLDDLEIKARRVFNG